MFVHGSSVPANHHCVIILHDFALISTTTTVIHAVACNDFTVQLGYRSLKGWPWISQAEWTLPVSGLISVEKFDHCFRLFASCTRNQLIKQISDEQKWQTLNGYSLYLFFFVFYNLTVSKIVLLAVDNLTFNQYSDLWTLSSALNAYNVIVINVCFWGRKKSRWNALLISGRLRGIAYGFIVLCLISFE